MQDTEIHMTKEEFQNFIDRTSAMALANKAILACLLSGQKFSMETIVETLGQWTDPTDPNFERLVETTVAHIQQVLDRSRELS